MNDLVPNQEANVSQTNQRGANGDMLTSDVLMHLVTFELLGEEFGVPILDVREIIVMSDITPVPNAPDFVEGVINLRGQIIPIVDLRKRFNLDMTDNNDKTRVVVVEIADNVLGLIVDGDSEVLRIPTDLAKPAPALIAGGIGSTYIKGIAYYKERMIILIDLHKVFSIDEIQKMESVDVPAEGADTPA